METDYEKLYNNLTVLLKDICQFLSSDKLGSLSLKDKKVVESLITRSKVQLQEIIKIEKLSATEEYVDMDAKKVSADEEEDGKLEVYSSVDDVNKISGNTVHHAGDFNKYPLQIIQETVICPYTDLPAREASQNVKYGFISMRKKFLLFDKMKRVYASIHNKWLLIYYTEKDSKPHCTFYLKHYEAKESQGPKSTTFELMSTFERKSYFFMALTPKDMLQWVVYINRCHDTAVVQSKLDIEDGDHISLEEDEGGHYDDINPGSEHHNEEMEDEDEIYLELDDLVSPSQKYNTTPQGNNEDNTGPPLPGRPQRTIPVPVSLPPKSLTPVHGSDSSLASYDDISDLMKKPDQTVNDQSSEDDDDDTYQAFVNVKREITKMSIPLIQKEQIEETKDCSEFCVEIKKEMEEAAPCKATDVKNEYISFRNRIELYQSNSPVGYNKDMGAEDKFRNKSQSFAQDVIKKPNFPPKPNIDLVLPNGSYLLFNKELKSPTLEPKDLKNDFNKSPLFETKKLKIELKSPTSESKEFGSSPSEATNTDLKSPTTEPKPFQRVGGLNPPVIKKVPVVPLKPKLRDKPFISQRPPFSAFRQMSNE